MGLATAAGLQPLAGTRRATPPGGTGTGTAHGRWSWG